MEGFKPIPSQADPGSQEIPGDDATSMARQRLSALLSPYQERFGIKPIVGSQEPGRPSSPGMPVPGSASPSAEDKLYQSIHPDTFKQIMESIMSLVTGKPIPRAEGGDVVPGEEYTVGERGPERFRPNVPGEIIPNDGGMNLMGPAARSPLPGPLPSAYRYLKRTMTPAYENPFEPGLPKFKLPGGDADTNAIPMERGRDGVYSATAGMQLMGPSYAGPAPWRDRAPTSAYPIDREHAGYAVPGEDWRNFEGMAYKVGPERFFAGGREVASETPGAVSGDELARQRILREAGQAGFHPIPGQIYLRSYYDVHPEERAQDEWMQRYDQATTGAERNRIAQMMETQTRTGMQYGPGSPESQERLAHAELMRRTPEIEAYRLSEQGRMHLEGINRQVAGHIEAARIAAEARDPIMKEIGAVLTQGQKISEMYGTPFDPVKTVGNVLKVYRAMGEITDEQWNNLPEEYKGQQWTEQTLRADLKKNGMKDADIESYVKRARAAGKI